jgi:hypothetical protein
MPTTEQTISSNLIALGFTNPSATALYNKIAQAVGQPVDNTLTEFNNTMNSILNLISTKNYGKDLYYTTIAKAFQLGDDLIVDPVTQNDVYAVIDPSKQIVTQAAFEEIINGNSSQLFLKIAKLDVPSGLLVPLANDEYAAFVSYFTTFELPGLPVAVINAPANILAFNATATFFKTYNLTTLQTNLLNALVAFRNTFEFNGLFFNGDLSDYLKQNVPGLRDFYLFNTTIDGAAFSGEISLDSGYFNYLAAILAAITNNITFNPI